MTTPSGGVLARLAALFGAPRGAGALLRTALAFALVATALPAVLDARTLHLGARVEIAHADAPAGTLDPARDALGVLGVSPDGGAGRTPQPATHAPTRRDPFATRLSAPRAEAASEAPRVSPRLVAELAGARRARLRGHAARARDDDAS